MCGIAGIYLFNDNEKKELNKLNGAISKLSLRGPDATGTFIENSVGLGHRRLSIIDTSESANQPLFDATERYVIIFNGEIFNFKELLHSKLQHFVCKTQSDTEVLLQLYIEYGVECLSWLRGFFALAIYDRHIKTLLVARDSLGKKPLLFFQSKNKFVFASEMKALMEFDIPRKIDYTSLYQFFQLNYIPSPYSVFENVCKLEPGHYILIKDNECLKTKYYEIAIKESEYKKLSYEQAQHQLQTLLNNSVEKRMISDVPLGAFLSGGIDSSVIVALASKHTKSLNTFSIGYKDEPLFDETKYANLVAKQYNTNHTVFSLKNEDFFEHVFDMLDYIDEPFADSSCIPTYILCKRTKQKATVALSGDGGDEVFAGYNKHAAEFQIRQDSWKNTMVKSGRNLWKNLPKSRNSKLGNIIRQLDKFAEGASLNVKDRYYRWCSITNEEDAFSLFNSSAKLQIDNAKFEQRKNMITQPIVDDIDFNQLLKADMQGVLVSDMLHKVDAMSMANSLEVRSPFLDVDVVNFAFTIPPEFKINKSIKKRIVQDSFRKQLPAELYNRPKQGFDLPLLNWFKTDLKSVIFDDLLSEPFIEKQSIFDYNTISKLKIELLSASGGNVVEKIWALIVFQYWWKKNCS
jgi:asparagine synthase (glutamine-hydrolysing)